jgi:uncharacterized protein YuzE
MAAGTGCSECVAGGSGGVGGVPIEGHYDRQADVVWLRCEDYDPRTVVGEETEIGVRELDPATGALVGLEVWQASRVLPADVLRML